MKTHKRSCVAFVKQDEVRFLIKIKNHKNEFRKHFS
jgi:hypothetical protein